VFRKSEKSEPATQSYGSKEKKLKAGDDLANSLNFLADQNPK
jgi:hypothetical protein